VGPRSIAYVAVQLRFALPSVTAWRGVDIDFDHNEFYTSIIDHFEVTPGPRTQAGVQELLAWWNEQVFGHTSGAGLGSSRRRGNSSMSIVAAQRRAREADSDD